MEVRHSGDMDGKRGTRLRRVAGEQSGSPSGSLSRWHKSAPPFARGCASAFTPSRLTKPVGTIAVRSHTPEPHSPPGGGEWGWEQPPVLRRMYSPAIGTYASSFANAGGVAPSPRLRRDSSLREGHEPACGGWRRRPVTPPAAGWASMWSKASSHGSPRPLTTSPAGSPTLGSRRASAAVSWSAGVTWAATTTVRRCARRAPLRGSGGCAPGAPGALRQRRERPGVRRGAQHPLASPRVRTRGRLAHGA